jgi:hypothetical protein
MPDLIRHPEKTKLDYPVTRHPPGNEPGNDKEEIATRHAPGNLPPERRLAMTSS